jgi:acyl carrier protein
MTPDAVLAAFTAVVRRLSEMPDLAVAPEMELADLGEFDSLRLMAAIALTEVECGVEIDAGAIGDFTIVADVVRAVLAASPSA